MSDLLIVLTCRRCGADVAPVNIGRVIAGREASVIVRCSDCSSEWHLTALLRPVTDPREDFPTLSPVALCGTQAGYRAHHGRGEKACDDCKRAHADAERARRPRPRAARSRSGPESWEEARIRERRELVALMGEG